MGWTSYARYNSPKTRAEERAEIIRLYTSLVPDAPYTAECLMASKVGTTWYVAIRLVPKPGAEIDGPVLRGYLPDGAGSLVYAGVILTGRHDGEWGYKDMSESMGPSQAEAPLKLMALLSPLDPEADTYARGWRERVAAHHAARRGLTRIAPGDRFEVETPFEFSSGLRAARFEAFRSAYPGRRATTLFRTLDTPTPCVVRIPQKALHAARPRLLEAEIAAD